MSDWDLLYIVTSAHWLPVTRSGAVIVPKTGLFFPVSPACLNSLCSLSLSFFLLPFITPRWAIYKTLFTSLTWNYSTFFPFSPIIFLLYIFPLVLQALTFASLFLHPNPFLVFPSGHTHLFYPSMSSFKHFLFRTLIHTHTHRVLLSPLSPCLQI